MNKDTGMSSKLNALLRLGLVSKNNVRRALYVMQNPEQAMKSASYRTLIQELLIDVVDRILNNKSLYNLVRQNLVKDSSSPVTEDVSNERTKTLLRSGLVKKKDVVVARRALSSKKNFKQMSQVGVYRELMIDMLDSMAKKITGNPVLFNAFKRTMGDQQVDESFEMPNAESIMEFGLNKDFTELLESHKPNNTKLWVESKKKAKGKFDTCPCEKCEEAWAMKWYNEHDGEWTPIAEGKSFFGFMDQVDEVLTPKQKKIDINKNKRLDAQDFKALRTAKVVEETEQVDELSKGLLKRYKAAATVNADNLEKEGDRYSRNVQHGNLTPKQKKLSMKIRSRMYGKSDERRFKIGQAERKLGEETEQIDELSKKTKDAYIAKRGSQLSSMMYGSGKNYNSLTGKKQANAVKGIKKAMGVKEDVEQVDEAGQAKLYRMRYSHGRAWRRGDKKKQDAMGTATYDKQKKEDAKDLNRTGSAFGMRVKRLAGNRKAMGYSESTIGEDIEQVDEAGQAKLYRMRYSHGRAWRRGDKKKQDAMGIVRDNKQKKEDAKDLNRTGSAFEMRVKRLAGNRKAMGYSESTLIGKQKKLDANNNKRLDSQDFKLLRSKKSVKEDKHDADGSSLEEGILNKAKAYAGGFKQAIGNTIDIFDVGDIIDRTKRYGKDRETRLNKKDAAAKKMQSKSVKEELVGGQKKLDANKNKRLDAEDFKALRTKIRKGIK